MIRGDNNWLRYESDDMTTVHTLMTLEKSAGCCMSVISAVNANLHQISKPNNMSCWTTSMANHCRTANTAAENPGR
jgi:hypothetical protein